MLAVERSLTAQQPYPGLRSFEAAEAVLFHGREHHVEELLRRLSATRLLAVIGGSGSGKSSLVRAGLLPALYRGYLTGATTRWRVAVMRPGSAPLAELTKALADPAALGSGPEPIIRESSYGLVNAFRSAAVPAGESLLLVVDQFEELFRFRRESTEHDGGAEAALFVSELLQAADEFGVPIYVVITMRSDFLGDCAQFPGLPEALNRGQYLIPRMTREQRRAAITASLEFFDAAMSDRLVQRLLNDAGDDPDQLPVLQHALQQTYSIWERGGRIGEIDLEHYETAGTMQRALDQHAERVYASTGASGWIAERIFRCLTVDENGRAVRRPARLERILRVIGASEDPQTEAEARRIIKLFADPENSFLLWGMKPDLEPDSVVDISHESLIRKWSRLQAWVRDEAKGVDIYRYLRRDASLYPNDAGLWSEPDLSVALNARKTMRWNEAWADQYSQSPGATFSKVQEFLEASVRDRDARLRREQRLRWLKAGVAGLLIVLVIVVIRLYLSEQERRASEQETRATLAEFKKLASLNNSLVADKERASAETSELTKQINDLQNRVPDKAELDRQLAELKQLKAEADKGATAKASELERQIKELQSRRTADLERLAALQRLRDEKDRIDKAVADREQLITENKKQVAPSGQDSSDLLKRINELQGQLKQAWDERDAVQGENGTVKRALSQNKAIETLVVKEGGPVTFPKDNPAVAFAMGFYGGDGPLYVLPLSQSRQSCGQNAPLRECLLGIIADPGPSCPSGGPLYCFIVRQLKTSSEIQQLGTIDIGQSSYALYSWGWVQYASGGPNAVNVAVVPIGPARTPSLSAK